MPKHGPFPQAGKLVILNPDALTQVRQVTGVDSPQWWEFAADPVFAEAAIDLLEEGTSGQYYLQELPTGLSAYREYPALLYADDATAFTDASDLVSIYPETTPLSIWSIATSTLTVPGSIGKWLLDNVLGALGGVIAPVLAVVRELSLASSTGGIDRALKLFENSRSTVSWAVTDGAGERYDLTGHAFAFVAHGQTGTTQFEINSTNEAAQFVLSSSESDSTLDVISVTLTPTELASANVGTWSYKMWDTTIDAVLGSGTLSIPHAPQA